LKQNLYNNAGHNVTPSATVSFNYAGGNSTQGWGSGMWSACYYPL